MKIFVGLLIFVTLAQAQNLANVRFNFYGSSLNDFVNIDIANAANGLSQLSTTYYNPAKKNFIFILGWQPADSSSVRDGVIGAMLNYRRADYNIINLDWSEYASSINYVGVISQLNPVIVTANNILVPLKSQGFSIGQTYITGFSFGVIIASGIGRFFKNYQNAVIGRITALEPPEFFLTLGAQFALFGVTKLSRSDAKFIDVIHTNVAQFGDGTSHGHADFWVNGGYNQPGCSLTDQAAANQTFSTWDDFVSTVGCSHGRSCLYFAESIGRTAPPYAFISNRCPFLTFIYNLNNCVASPTSMGFNADTTFVNPQKLSIEVNFYLETKSTSPFSKS